MASYYSNPPPNDPSKLNPLGDFQTWLNANGGKPLIAAFAIVVGLGFWSKTRPYAVPIGVIIMATWFFKWQRKGGHL